MTYAGRSCAPLPRKSGISQRGTLTHADKFHAAPCDARNHNVKRRGAHPEVHYPVAIEEIYAVARWLAQGAHG